MRHVHGIKLASATVSIAAALASPTFGVVTLVLQPGAFNPSDPLHENDSRIIYNHTAESLDPASNVRNLTKVGSQILKSSAPGYQLPNATLSQVGDPPNTGSSTGRIGVGYITDTRSVSLTVQSLTFVNQNEVNTSDENLRMDGDSTISADFRLVFQATGTGTFGSPMIGRIAIPLAVTLPSGSQSTAGVSLENVRWEVDQASDGLGNFFDARPEFNQNITFTSSTSTTISSDSQILKNTSGQTLVLLPGDIFVLSGKLTFLANGNSPADFFLGSSYNTEVFADNPLRYYQFNESSPDSPPIEIDTLDEEDEEGPPVASFGIFAIDSSTAGDGPVDGQYNGNTSPGAFSAAPGLGTAAFFPTVSTASTFLTSGPTTGDVELLGFGDVITAPHSDELLFADPMSASNAKAFTIEAWINPLQSHGDGTADDDFYATIVSKQDAQGSGWRFGISDRALYLGDDSGGGIDAVFALPGSDIFDFDTFYHVVAVHDGAGLVSFYVNGELLGTAPYSLFEDSLDLLRIGNGFDDFTGFGGIIDEVAIYGSALSPERVRIHYGRGSDPFSIAPLFGLEIDENFVEPIPEPATATLAMIMMSGLALARRRQGSDR